MTVNVLLFSVLRDIVGADYLPLVIESESATLGEILSQLYADYPALQLWDTRLLLAVNAEFAVRETIIRDGDEIALMPPVQGG